MKINQITKEYQAPALNAVTATDTSVAPSRGFAIKVLGPIGNTRQTGTPAATLWYGLTAVFPNDYPPADFQSAGQQMASPQARVLNTIRREGSAVVKSGITSRDLAETLANKLASYGPHPSEPNTSRIPMSQIQVISQDLEEGVAEGFKNTYSVGDRVDGPLGTGTIVAVSKNVNVDGRVKVKLDDPSRAGEDGKYKDSFVLDTTQLKHISEQGVAEGEKIGNMDADAFDAAMARLKKLAGAGPLKTVYDPARRVYKNVPHAVQPAQQPKKSRR